MGKVIHGDNLAVLKDMPDDSVDLICTDPPFASGREFSTAVGSFSDKWDKVLGTLPGAAGAFIEWARVGHSEAQAAFLMFMGERLLEMHRVLKPGGAIYLQCDDSACHYLKCLMDAIWGRSAFMAQIVWERAKGDKAHSKNWGRNHDILLMYGAGRVAKEAVKNPLKQSYIDSRYRYEDEHGRYFHDNMGALSPDGWVWEGARGKWRACTALPDWFEKPEGYGGMSVKQKLDAQKAGGLIHFTKSGRPEFKRYLSTSKGEAPTNVWCDIDDDEGPGINKDAVLVPQSDDDLAHYDKEDARGAFHVNTLTAPSAKGCRDWRGLTPPAGTSWRAPRAVPPWFKRPGNYDLLTIPEKLDVYDAQGLIYWSATGRPYFKRYKVVAKGRAPTNLWTDIDDDVAGDIQRADERGTYTTISITKGTGKERVEWRGVRAPEGFSFTVPQNLPGNFIKPAGYDDMPWDQRLDALDAAGLIYWSSAGRPYYKFYNDLPRMGEGKTNVWTDISPSGSGAHGADRYPTQKPVRLYERMIKASSNQGDTVLDPFCGSGTTLVAAYQLDRDYIGIDQSEDAVRVAKERLGAARGTLL